MSLISNTVTVRVNSATVLRQAASGLASNGTTTLTYNPLGLAYDIQWMTTCIFYDATRKELQYMGKPASSQSTNHRHYIYNETTNTWRTTGTSLFPSLGHIWSATFDPDVGDYYFHRSNDLFVRRMNRNVEAGGGISNNPWTQTSSDSAVISGNQPPVAAVGWHPHLYGTNDGGLVDWRTLYVMGWRKATDTWNVIGGEYYFDGKFFNNASGCAAYLPGLQKIILASTGTQQRMMSIAAGSNGTTAPVVDLGTGPIGIVGDNGNSGKLIVDPTNSSYALILRHNSPYTVWRSTDGGVSWDTIGTHPFTTVNMSSESNGTWTCGSLPDHGVVVGMSSNGNGNGTFRLWKPPV